MLLALLALCIVHIIIEIGITAIHIYYHDYMLYYHTCLMRLKKLLKVRL